MKRSICGCRRDGPGPQKKRPIKRSRPPPRPAGLQSTSAEAKARWKADSFRYPPYTCNEWNMVQDVRGQWFKLPAEAREVLMGFRKGHTLQLDRSKGKNLSYEELEDLRCSALGNSFQTTVLAALFNALCGEFFGLPKKGPADLSKDLAQDVKEVVKGCDADSVAGSDHPDPVGEDEEEWHVPDSSTLQTVGRNDATLMSLLVQQYLRRTEVKGSDVRLDIGLLFKPGAIPRTSIDPTRWNWYKGRAWKWQKAEHINLLEMRAALHALQWKSRRTCWHYCRTMVLMDSQVAIAVMSKGRSSSRKVNQLLRRFCAFALALNIYPLLCWVDTADNPADEWSRLFD